MNRLQHTAILFFASMLVATQAGCQRYEQKGDTMKLHIILGSTRHGRSSDTIARALKQVVDRRKDIIAEIVDLRDFDLPFLAEEIFPSKRTVITDPTIQKWSDTIQRGDAFIIVVPEYNAGYPGVLKNALDLLYKEWNHKPVAFVGYSGGPSGGKNAIAQLRQVTGRGLEMKPVEAEIHIPQAWKAFDAQGKFVDQNIEQGFQRVVDQILAALQS